MESRIRIGTSGWSYDHWVGPFYPSDLPASRRLEHYAQALDSTEINHSFAARQGSAKHEAGSPR